jgi:hypothetical protein
MDDRRKNLILARSAEQAGQYTDMLEFMLSIVPSETDITIEEFNLFSLAAANFAAPLRSALKALAAEERRAEASGVDSDHMQLIKGYKKDIRDRCDQFIVRTVVPRLQAQLPKVSSDNHTVHVSLLTMIADYYRYLTELSFDGSNQYEVLSEQHYREATLLAAEFMEATDPIRLAVALNYSIFMHEIKQQPDLACEIAHTAFETAFGNLDNVDDDGYGKTTAIMQLLRDNLTLWTSKLETPDAPL